MIPCILLAIYIAFPDGLSVQIESNGEKYNILKNTAMGFIMFMTIAMFLGLEIRLRKEYDQKINALEDKLTSLDSKIKDDV